MIKIAVISNNKTYIELTTNIKQINKNIKLLKTNRKNIYKLILNKNINILIIEYNDFMLIDNITLINLISKLNLIIILTNEQIIKNNSNKFIFCNKLHITQILDEFIRKKYINYNTLKKNIKNQILEELKYLGYNLSYSGTQYLIESIYYLYTQKSSYPEISMKKIYSILAKQHNKSENTIKCNITRATSIMFYECDESKLKKYLGLCTFPKTGSKIIIQTIINKLNFS